MHCGFWHCFSLVKQQVEAELRKLDPHKPLRVVWTGHSLGGAIAQVAAAYFAQEPRGNSPWMTRHEVISFCSPRVFCTWNDALRRVQVSHTRIVHPGDILTGLPWDIMGYSPHVDPVKIESCTETGCNPHSMVNMSTYFSTHYYIGGTHLAQPGSAASYARGIEVVDTVPRSLTSIINKLCYMQQPELTNGVHW